ncbi:MAG TPA: heavy metal-responsive transcriptional regulator [Pyrinomonadaceae bacterium]|nr:heavy metal-responsive transcriptional regulator [Pyrinomonadaceae bacterium]
MTIRNNAQRREPFSMRTSMKIGEVSRESGIGIEALRFYERSGLLGRPARTQSGYRLYDESILERLAFIKKAQTLGFTLDEIRHIIGDAEKGASPCEDVRAILRSRLSEVAERIRELQRYHREITNTVKEWDKIGRAPGSICGLIEGAEVQNPAPVSGRVVRKRQKRA